MHKPRKADCKHCQYYNHGKGCKACLTCVAIRYDCQDYIRRPDAITQANQYNDAYYYPRPIDNRFRPNLSTRHVMILAAISNGSPRVEIAESLNISKQRLSKIISQVLNIIKLTR